MIPGFKQVDEMPKAGTFTMMWCHNGHLWAQTFMYKDGRLYRYDDFNGEWTTEFGPPRKELKRYYFVEDK
jgi:hypothetical protein